MLEPFLAKNHCHQFAANLGETFNLCKGSTCSTNTNIMKNLEKPQHTWRNIQIPPFQAITSCLLRFCERLRMLWTVRCLPLHGHHKESESRSPKGVSRESVESPSSTTKKTGSLIWSFTCNVPTSSSKNGFHTLSIPIHMSSNWGKVGPMDRLARLSSLAQAAGRLRRLAYKKCHIFGANEKTKFAIRINSTHRTIRILIYNDYMLCNNDDDQNNDNK